MMNNQSYDSFWNTAKRGFMRMPTAIRWIIGSTTIVFLIQMLGGNFVNNLLFQAFAFDPSFPTVFIQPWRLITYAFLHVGFLHFLFNMLWLYWIGRSVEETIGPRSFTIVYFSAAIFGALLDAIFANIFGLNLVIGASGAVTGVLVAFAMLYPRAPIMLFLLPPIEARYFVVGWVLIDVLFIGKQDSVARLVHIGGALSGYLLLKAYKNGTDLSVIIRYFEYLFGKLKPSRKPRNKNMSIVRDVEVVEEVEQSELDEILEKISKDGYDALTKEEKQKLFELSKKK